MERRFDSATCGDFVLVAPATITSPTYVAGGRVWVEIDVDAGNGRRERESIALSAADARAMGEHLIALAEASS